MTDNVLRFNFLVGRNEVPAAAEKNAGALHKLASKTASFGKVAAVALGGAAAAAGGLAAAGAVMGVKTAAALETAQIGFTTLLGSAKKAGAYLNYLKGFAASTPFQLPGLIESSRTLLGVGMNLKQVKSALQDYGDAAAALGIDQEHFRLVMIALSQVFSSGTVHLQDLNQMANDGLPIWPLLSKALGLPVMKIRDLISHGKLLSKDVLPKLQAEMHKDYGGAMAKQSQTLAGLWSTLMDTLNLGMGSVLQPLLPTLKNLASDGIEFLGGAFKRLPGLITGAMTGLGHVKDYVTGTVLPGVRGAVRNLGKHLPHVDLGQVFGQAKDLGARVAAVLLPAGASILAAAKTWGTKILDGVTTGLHSGNWQPLGKVLGDGLAQALGGLGTASNKIVAAVTAWFGTVDWLEVGKTVGGKALSFAIGFVNGLGSDLIDVARKHPMDLALFVASFVGVGKFLTAFKPVRAAIEHLPLGSWFLWLLDHTAAPVFDGVKRFFGFLIGGFASGFKAAFPEIASGISRLIRGGIIDEIRLRAGYAVEAARDFVWGIAHSIGHATGLVVRAIGSLIGDMVRPFAKAGGWLVGKGVDLVVGLARGIGSVLGRVGGVIGAVIRALTWPFRTAISWLRPGGSRAMLGLYNGVMSYLGRIGSAAASVIRRLLSPFAKAGGWLVAKGREVLTGFLSGMRSVWDDITRWVGNIAQWIRDHKGPISLDARLLIPAGVAIMTGFYHGLKSGAGKAWDFVKSVGGKSVDALRASLGYFAGGGAANGVGNLTYNARLGKVMAGQQYGWGQGVEWASLWNLWQRESNWNNYARNPSSGAYGIPQSLPPGKMGAAANPPRSDAGAQITWGLNYIRQRYGDPQSAWDHETRFGWYDRGGLARGAGLLAKGPQPEYVLSGRQTDVFLAAMQRVGRGGGTGIGGTVINVTMRLDPSAHAFEAKVESAVRNLARSRRLSPSVVVGR